MDINGHASPVELQLLRARDSDSVERVHGGNGHLRFPMPKGVKNMPRYREIALAANSRYQSALTVVTPLDDSRQEMRRPGSRVHTARRSHRALNPASEEDVNLLTAVMRGEHLLQGFRNADIRDQLFASTLSHRDRQRQSQKVGRLLSMLHAHKVIAKVPRSRL